MKATEMKAGSIYKFTDDDEGGTERWVEVESVEVDSDGDVIVSGYWGTESSRLACGTGLFDGDDEVTDVRFTTARAQRLAR